MLLGRAWFPSHSRGREKKRVRPFLELDETDSPTRKKSWRYVCSQTQPRGLRPQKVSSAIKVVTRFLRSRLSKMHLHCDSRPRRCIASTARHGRARIAFAFAPKTIPFVVVSKDEVGLTARACETSRDERACARGTSNWLKTVITEPRFESAHYFGGDVKGTSTCDWSKERNCRAAEVQRSAVDEKHANACANSDTESAHYYFIPNRSVVLIAKSTRDARLIKARSI